MIVQAATHDDADAICGVWNGYIRDTTVTFTTAEKTAQAIRAYIDARRTGGKSVFIAREGDSLLGFAAASDFRSGPGYRHSLETSVMLAPNAIGRGAGRALMKSVEAHAREAGIHVLIAGISGDNPPAVAFHHALGFKEVGKLPETGRKFDVWLDLVFMQKLLVD